MATKGKWIKRQAAVLSLGVVIGGIGLLYPNQIELLELAFVDAAQELRGPRRVPDGITIVAIDDFSLQQASNTDLSERRDLRSLQHWPWPRRIYATVLDRLFACGVKAVGVDLLFDSPSIYGPNDDQVLAVNLKRFQPKVVLAAQVLESRGAVGGLSLLRATPALSAALGTNQHGLLNGFQDADGVIRQRPNTYATTVSKSLGKNTPRSLGVALLQAAELPVDHHVKWDGWLPLLDPYGPPRTIPTLSIWQLLEPNSYAALKESGQLRNQLVLIGPTATALQDLHQTAFARGAGMPGVEIHATEIANRIEGRSLLFPHKSPGWSLLLGVMVVLMALASQRWERPLTRLGILTATASGLLLLSLILIAQLGLEVGLVSLSAGALAAGVTSSAGATLKLQWQKRRLRQSLGRYLSPAVAAEIANQPEEADDILGGRLTEVVVLMTDIRSFTSFTQSMSASGQVPRLVERLNLYFSEVVEAIHQRGGTVDKFIGDAALAVFGAPIKRSSQVDAKAAIEAALDIEKRLAKLNQHWNNKGEESWEQVIVLSYGTVISGNIGSRSRMDYTVIGDAVNTASRLEKIAKQSNQTVVMSEDVAQLLGDQWTLEDLGSYEIRGQKAQHVYAIKSVHDKAKFRNKSSKEIEY